MKLSDPILNEVFILWPAWQELVEHTMPTGTQARDVRPLDVFTTFEALDAERVGRLLHLMVGHAQAETVDEARALVAELRDMASVDRRPRFGSEAGLTLTHFMDMHP